MSENRQLLYTPFQIPVSTASGALKPFRLPFSVLHIGIMNQTAAQLYFALGEYTSKPIDSLPISPWANITFPIPDSTQTITFFWEGTVAFPSNQVTLIMSADPIPLYGGVFNPDGVTSSVTVASGNISVVGSVEIANDSGNPIPSTITAALPAGTNNIGKMDVLTMPALQVAGDSYLNVTASGDVAVKASAGVLDRIIINTSGAAASTLTVTDGGTTVGVIDLTKWGAIEFGLAFSTNLHVNPSATCDITVIYR